MLTGPRSLGRIKVALIDDSPEIRGAIAQRCAAATDIQWAGAFANADEFLKKRSQSRLDVLLLDWCLPGLSGLECLCRLRKSWPQLRIIVLSGYNEAAVFEQAVAAGAAGFVVKTDAADLLDSIRRAFQGDPVLSPSAVKHALAPFRKADPDHSAAESASVGSSQPLSQREEQILRLARDGLLEKEIADHLAISANTVHVHFQNIFHKLGVHSRAAALEKSRHGFH